MVTVMKNLSRLRTDVGRLRRQVEAEGAEPEELVITMHEGPPSPELAARGLMIAADGQVHITLRLAPPSEVERADNRAAFGEPAMVAPAATPGEPTTTARVKTQAMPLAEEAAFDPDDIEQRARRLSHEIAKLR
jgi:hypothetical protein